MKLIVPIMMLLLGSPLFGQTRVLIDNRTDHEVNTDLIHRLTTEALVNAPVRKATILVHIWPRTALRSMTERKTNAFFVSPNHVFMHEVDYLALIQGVLLVIFPDEALDDLERNGRRIWLMDQMVVRLETFTEMAESSR